MKKVILIAKNEEGYLEKKSNSQLDSKTANAGSANYTKYWRDIEPSYQGQPWCAAFVSWCFMKAFGLEKAKKIAETLALRVLSNTGKFVYPERKPENR